MKITLIFLLLLLCGCETKQNKFDKELEEAQKKLEKSLADPVTDEVILTSWVGGVKKETIVKKTDIVDLVNEFSTEE